MKYLFIFLMVATAYSQSLTLKATNQLKSFEFYGHVYPKLKSTLSSLIEGQISKRYIEIGDFVNKGQLLYTLDLYPQNFQLESIKLERKRIINQLKFLELKLSRRVKNEDAYTEETVEEVQLQVSDNKLQLEVIDSKILLLKETLTKKEIRAPYDGVIVSYFKDLGEFITIASPLVSMMSVNEPFTRILVNRVQAKSLHLKQQVSILNDKQILKGEILRIHPSEDKNHMRTIDIQMNTQKKLVVNQVLKVRIDLNKSFIKIPKQFVKDIHGVSTIQIRKNKELELKEVSGDFIYNDFVTDNLSLEGLILERF